VLPKEFFKLFMKNKPILWLCGHNHRGEQHIFENIPVFVSEATSICHNSLGFRLLTLYPDKSFDWDFIPLF
jgi:hypothetical protein